MKFSIALISFTCPRFPSGNLSFAIYRKPNHTNIYLKFLSNHPTAPKHLVVKSLADRATNLCNVVRMQQDIHKFENILKDY